jgi:hypothetical protein
MGTTKGTIPKARAFFLHGAQHVDIPLGRSLVSGRSPAATRRRRGVRRGSREEVPPGMRVLPAREQSLHPLIKGLIEDLPLKNQSWDATSASRWLELARPTFAYAYNFEYPPVDATRVSEAQATPS